MRVRSNPNLLHVGSHGKRVEELEKRLKKLGHLDGPVNDTFDKATRKAVLEFKKENGWDDPKGVVGGKALAALKLDGPGGVDAPTKPNDDVSGGSATPNKMNGGTYNAEIGRNPKVVQSAVKKALHDGKLDYLQLQEISGYHKELRAIPGYKLITFKTQDHGETGILVRKGIKVEHAHAVEADTGWTNVHGRPAQPRAATSVKLAGWLRVASVHAPPGIDWVNGRAQGGADRVKSYQSLTKKLAAEANRTDSAILYGGDWNEGARTGGPGSPSWLAEKAGLKKFANGGIDWQMGRGVQLTNHKRGDDFGSDHHLWTYTVTRPKQDR